MRNAERLICLMGFLTLWSCVGATVPSERIRHYVLEYAHPSFEKLTPLNAIIKVDRFTAAAPYNQEMMVYKDQAFQRQTDYYNRWRVSPAAMLSDFVARDLRNSGLYQAVLRYDSFDNTGFRLEGDVTEFLEEDVADARYAVLSVNTILVDETTKDSSKWVVWQKSYHYREQCRAQSPESVVEAMSAATAAFTKRLCADVYAGMEHRLKSKGLNAVDVKRPGT